MVARLDHNTRDVSCVRREADDIEIDGEVCYVCHPVGAITFPPGAVSVVSDGEAAEAAERIMSIARHPSSAQTTGEVTYPDWFHRWVDENAGVIAAKAAEYGTNSLVEMGRVFARAQGREIDEEQAIELGCMLYAYGKMQRVVDAALKGQLSSYDTWNDLLVYSSMAMFARTTGRWP